MAENVRGDRVVEPGRTAEYDRINPEGPILIVFFAVFAILVGTMMAVTFIPLGDGLVQLVLIAVSITAIIVAIGRAAKLAEGNRARAAELTRDLGALRSIVVFDEYAVGDDVLWVAAELAEQYERLDDEGAPLAAARVRTAAQDAELAERESTLHELATRILSLVEPATV